MGLNKQRLIKACYSVSFNIDVKKLIKLDIQCGINDQLATFYLL